MVTPYNLSIFDIVNAWWVTIINLVVVIFVNSELNLQINQELIELLLKTSKGGKISEDHVLRISKMQEKLNEFTKERTLSNKKDLDFMKEITQE